MNILDYAGDMIRPPQWPSFLIFFVTNRCMMKCRHCFYWQNLNSAADELSIKEIEKIAESMPRLLFLRLTGGEPFMRKDLSDIVSAFYYMSSVRRVAVSSNGFLTDQIIKTTEHVTESLPQLDFEVGISIDNLDQKHDQQRACPGAFKKAIETYHLLYELKQRRQNLRTGFVVTMTRDNQDDLDDVIQYLRSLSPDGIGLNLIRGKPRDTSLVDTDIDRYDKIRWTINDYNFNLTSGQSWIERMRRNKTVMSQNAIINMLKKQRREMNCVAGKHISVLYPNGDLAACELLNKFIGNVREYDCSVQTLWREGRRKEILKYIEDSRCFCTHECFITANEVFSSKRIINIAAKTLTDSLLSKSSF